jgi:hypothetical protein
MEKRWEYRRSGISKRQAGEEGEAWKIHYTSARLFALKGATSALLREHRQQSHIA